MDVEGFFAVCDSAVVSVILISVISVKHGSGNETLCCHQMGQGNLSQCNTTWQRATAIVIGHRQRTRLHRAVYLI